MRFYKNTKIFSVEDLIKYPEYIQFIDSFLGSFFVSTHSIIDYLIIAKFRFQKNKLIETDFNEIDKFLRRRKLMLGIKTNMYFKENKALLWRKRLLALLESNQTFVREFLLKPNYYTEEAKTKFYKSIYFWLETEKSDNNEINLNDWINDYKNQADPKILESLQIDLEEYKRKLYIESQKEKSEPKYIYDIFNFDTDAKKIEIYNKLNQILLSKNYISYNKLGNYYSLNFPNKENAACTAIYYCLVTSNIIEGSHEPKLLQKLFQNWFKMKESKSLDRSIRDCFTGEFAKDGNKKELFIDKIEQEIINLKY